MSEAEAQSSSGPRKRRRTVSKQPSYHYCRSCQKRRVKCDGERPACQRCVAAGIACEGYAIWELEIQTPDPPPPPTRTDSIGDEDRQHQLLVEFVQQYSPQYELAASGCFREGSLFLRHLPQPRPDLVLMTQAKQTLCLAHVAVLSDDPDRANRPLQESLAQLFAALRPAIAPAAHPQTDVEHKDIIATMVVLSLMPSTNAASPIMPDQQDVHLIAAKEYIDQHGSAFLHTDDEFDLALYRHIFIHARSVTMQPLR